jgi:NADPH:quinone reductase-like Zn-dependent oxidoreductase
MQEQMENIIRGIKEGALTPIVDSIYDAKDVASAHQHIHDGKNIGKVLLKFIE